jgi:hypothetical protein
MVFRHEAIAQCMEGGSPDGARYLLPWAFLSMVMRDPRLSRNARLQMLSLSFAILFTWAAEPSDPAVARQQRRPRCPLPLVFVDKIHLHRACNLCIALYYAILRYDRHGLALSRIGSHSCEVHFGSIRSMLRGCTTFERWVTAEAVTIVMDAFADDIGLNRAERRGRAMGGVDVPASSEETADCELAIDARIGVLVELARGFARCDDQDNEDMCFAFWALVNEWLGSFAKPAKIPFSPSPMQGLWCNARRFV